jgi:hypothetical protein
LRQRKGATFWIRKEIHHQKQTFQKEYLRMLKTANVDYDEKYLW